jgi:hypothetical protein
LRAWYQRGRGIACLLALAFAALAGAQPRGEWIRPRDAAGPLVWGRTGGVVFGIRSPGGLRGPRGLIRVGVPVPGHDPELVNFIAIEPVTAGFGARVSRMGFSELEMSQLDRGERGKRMWVDNPRGDLIAPPAPPSLFEQLGGALTGPPPPPLEILSVRIEVEPYTINRAHVYVVASMSSDRPGEVRIAVHHHPDSAPLEELTPTATMGNYERLRYLWLKDRVVDSRQTPGEIREFRDLDNFPLDEMLRYGDGDALVLATTNEAAPGSVTVPQAPGWTYRAPKLTQYWRVPARHIQPDLRVRVNVRQTYWASKVEIPGGPAFENFEVRQRYAAGQEFIFGLTPQAPSEVQPKIPRLAARP